MILFDIVRNSANYGGRIYDKSSAITVIYSDVQDGFQGEGNIATKPLFIDVDNNDYHLSNYLVSAEKFKMLGVDWQIHANVRRICQSDGSGIRENQQILFSCCIGVVLCQS